MVALSHSVTAMLKVILLSKSRERLQQARITAVAQMEAAPVPEIPGLRLLTLTWILFTRTGQR